MKLNILLLLPVCLLFAFICKNQEIISKDFQKITFTTSSGPKLYSINGGYTWNKNQSFNNKNYISIKFSTCSNKQLVSTNGGYTWENYTLLRTDYNLDFNPKVKIYPNPASDFLRISFEGQVDYTYSLLLKNQIGITIYELSNISDINHLLSLNNLAYGLYYLILYNENYQRIIPFYVD